MNQYARYEHKKISCSTFYRYSSGDIRLDTPVFRLHYTALAALPNSIDYSRAIRVINQTRASRSPARQATLHSTGRYRKFTNPPRLRSTPANVRTAALANPNYRHVLLESTHNFAVYRGRIIKTFLINDTLLPMLTKDQPT